MGEGRQIGVGGPRQRAVLAILALHANDVVSRDRLIDELWGESPPETAQTAVQVYVSQLRKALGADRIETRSPGYRLRVEPEELDLERFERLVEEARRAPAKDAAERLRLALDTWRGPALADLDDTLALPERARLEEERMSALELRVAVDLDLGRHEELVAELEGLVREHPLRERLRGQLMVALYRSERQADALEAYREGRRLLDQELGLQPGEELRRLERAILEQDPALSSPAAADVALGAMQRRVRVLRRSRVVALVGALLLAGAIAGIVVALTGGSSAPVPVLPNSVAVVNAETKTVVASVPIGGRPVAIAVGFGAVWVGNGDDGTVSRIDPNTYEVVKTIGLGVDVSDLAVGHGSVWVAGGNAGTLTRIDPRLNAVQSTINFEQPNQVVARPVFYVATDASNVWATESDRLVKIDPRTDEVTDRLALGTGPVGLAAGAGNAWISTLDERLLRIDAGSVEVTATLALPAQGMFPLVSRGRPWLLVVPRPFEHPGQVWRIDPATMVQTGTATLPSVSPWQLTAGDGALWSADFDTGGLLQVDPASVRLARVMPVRPFVSSIAAGYRLVWIGISAS